MTISTAGPFLLFNHYDTDTVGEAIRLSMAPIFLVAALGHYLTVLVSRKDNMFSGLERLRRDIDGLDEHEQNQYRQRLIGIYRNRWISLTMLIQSIQLVTVVVLLTAIVVIVLFVSSETPLKLSGLVLQIFAVAMICLICSSPLFLKELSMTSREYD